MDTQWASSAMEFAGCVLMSLVRVQVTLSGRDIDKGMSLRTSGAQINAIPSSQAEGSVSHLKLVAFAHAGADGFLVFAAQISTA